MRRLLFFHPETRSFYKISWVSDEFCYLKREVCDSGSSMGCLIPYQKLRNRVSEKAIRSCRREVFAFVRIVCLGPGQKIQWADILFKIPSPDAMLRSHSTYAHLKTRVPHANLFLKVCNETVSGDQWQLRNLEVELIETALSSSVEAPWRKCAMNRTNCLLTCSLTVHAIPTCCLRCQSANSFVPIFRTTALWALRSNKSSRQADDLAMYSNPSFSAVYSCGARPR